MKKTLLLVVSVICSYFLSAQVTEDFTAYEVGGKVAQQAQAMGYDYWTTWSNNPGSAEDGVIGEIENNKVCNILPNNDLVLLLGNKTEGIWEYSMDVYVPEGKVGYFNILSKFAGSGSQWAMQVYFNAINDGGQNPTVPNPTQGCIHAGAANAAQFTCAYNTWMHVKVSINLDTDQATFYVNDQEVHSWQWTAGSFGQGNQLRRIDAMDIYASPEDNMEFSVDNIVFEHKGGGAPNVTITPNEFNVTLNQNSTKDETVNIKNSGSSIADYYSWITFDDANGTVNGEAQNNLTYGTGNYGTSIGYTSGATHLIEVAAKYTGNMYGNVMGTEIRQATYYLSSPVQGDKLTFRIYAQDEFSIPGEVLAEVEVNSSMTGQWVLATFPTPVYLEGQDVWVAVEFTQTGLDNEYPISSDDGIAVTNSNWIRTNSGAWEQMTNVGPNQESIGCFMITAITYGEPVLGSWVKLTGDNLAGALATNEDVNLNLHFDSNGLSDGEYTAKLKIQTNDPNTPLKEIPIKLTVGGASTCATPQNGTAVQSEQQNQIGLLVSWDAVANATKYEVYSSGQLLGEIDDNAVFIYGLEFNIEYCFQIKAICGNESSELSDPICGTILGIEDATELAVYPNPAKDFINITNSSNIDELIIYNTLGQVVYQSENCGKECKVNVADFNSGIYIIVTKSADTINKMKVIVE